MRVLVAESYRKSPAGFSKITIQAVNHERLKMTDDLWCNFLLRCFLVSAMNRDAVEAVLEKSGLSKDSSLTACQFAIMEDIGDAAWWRGINFIRERTGG